jgi:hypothetical protein
VTPQFIDFDALEDHLTRTCEEYEKTAPAVSRYADDLYIRLKESPETVVLPEILFVSRLAGEGTWMQPNYAANQLLHLLHRLKRDTTGLAGF